MAFRSYIFKALRLSFSVTYKLSPLMFYPKSENALVLGSIRCKHSVRWQHLSQIKASSLWLAENVFSPIKTERATSEASAATNKQMDPLVVNLGYMEK